MWVCKRSHRARLGDRAAIGDRCAGSRCDHQRFQGDRDLGLGLGGRWSWPSRDQRRWWVLAAGSAGAGGRAGLAAFHAVLDAGEMRSRDARVARHCDEWGMPTCVRSAQRHLPRIRQSGLKLAGASFVLAGSEGPRSTDTAPNPVHRSFGRRFCRTDRTGPCGLAATPP